MVLPSALQSGVTLQGNQRSQEVPELGLGLLGKSV